MDRIVFMRNRELAFWKKGMFFDGEVEQIIFLYENCESVFWKQRMFFGAPVPKFWWRFCENQGHENFVLASCSFKLHRLAFTWLDAMKDIREPG